MTPREILIQARERIAQPHQWIKGEIAQNSLGQPVRPTSPRAVCFCLVGAIPIEGGLEVIYALRNQLPDPTAPLASFNDHPDTTHADVLALIDRTIASLENAS